MKQVFQLKLLNPHDKQLQFIVSGIFKFYNIQWLDYFKYFFYPVGENSVITHCSNKKLKIPFQKTELGIPCLSYLGPISFVGLRTFVAFLCYPYRYSVFYVFIFVLQQQFLVFSRHDKEINLCNYLKLHQVYSSSFQWKDLLFLPLERIIQDKFHSGQILF